MRVICAVIQMSSGPDKDRNLERAGELVSRAVGLGAQLVALPENFAFMRKDELPLDVGESLEGRIACWARETASRHGITLLAGSFPEATGGKGKVYNTSLLVGPEGNIVGVYRKIHLFDVAIEGGESHRESSYVEAGREVVVADTDHGRVGMTVCYDIRFPELYRQLAAKGATIVFAPAAFTLHTGKDHWEVLVRARAIENQFFLMAPAQQGRHSARRVTYGHSMIVDPWGTVLSRVGDGEGVGVAEVDMDRLGRIRESLPCLSHRVL